VNRLWSQVGVRVTSVGLLLAGVAGGVYLGQDQEVQQQSVEASLVVQADAAEMDLLKERHAEHAAARAPQRKAEADAAAKAAREAKAAASKARKLEKASLKKKADAAEAAKAAKDTANDENAPAQPFTGPIPTSCKEYSGNRAIGCAILLSKGFGLGQMPCLDKLWKKESGWNHKASNRSSGAYGIPQALPGNKMASEGKNWRTSPEVQIKWGLGYIKGRYGNPCGAWSHSQNHGWY
jgi:hypothetical protein